MGYIIITLILIFGSTLTVLVGRIEARQRRMEHSQAAQGATLRTLTSYEPDGDEPEPLRRKRHLALYEGGAAGAVATLLALLRRHWLAAATTSIGAMAAGTLAFALAFGHAPATAGPPRPEPTPTAALTDSTIPTRPSSRGSRAAAARAPSPIMVTTVVLAGGAPLVTTIPVPSTTGTPSPRHPSPSASPTTATPSATPTVRVKPTASGAPCVVPATVPALVGICLL